MRLKASTSRPSSSPDVTSTRASRSPAASRCVARVSRLTGSEIRSAAQNPIADPIRMKVIAASSTRRSSSSSCRSMPRWRRVSGTLTIACPSLDPHRRRGDQVLVGADRLAGQVRGPPVEGQRAIDVAGGARRQEARGEQVAFARGQQPRTGKDVDVLADDAAQPDQQAVVEHRDVGGAAGLDADEVLDDAARRRRRAGRLALDVGAQRRRHVGAGDDRQRHHRHDHGGDEGEEQRAIEAGPHLAQQGPARHRRAPAQPRRHGQPDQQRRKGEAGQRDHFGQRRQVSEQRHPRMAHRVDRAAVVQQVDVRGHAAIVDHRPERLARGGELAEDGIRERPGIAARGVQRPAAPAVDRKRHLVAGRGVRRSGVGPQQLDVRVLRGQERQVAVVEDDVHDHRADGAGAAAAVLHAHGPAGVEQPALLGEERRHLLEQLPAARRFLPRLVGGGLGQVEGEAVHHPPGGVVELDRRGQAAGRQRGLRPDVEGRIDGDRAAGAPAPTRRRDPTCPPCDRSARAPRAGRAGGRVAG